MSLAEEFATISSELRTGAGKASTLRQIVTLAVETVPGCTDCGVSVRRRDGHLDTLECTSPVVREADEEQDRLGEGPALQVDRKFGALVVPDVTADQRWPRWGQVALGLGLRSLLCLELPARSRPPAYLTLFAAEQDAFDATDLALASIYARHAADALDVVRKVTGLDTALRSRQVIGVAQGMLMQQYRISLDQAFEVLRRYSHNHNVRIRDLAEQLVLEGHVSTTEGALRSSPGLDATGSHTT